MNRQKEIAEAATKGISEYLRSTRGAAACGPNAQVECTENTVKVWCSDGKLIFADFREI